MKRIVKIIIGICALAFIAFALHYAYSELKFRNRVIDYLMMQVVTSVPADTEVSAQQNPQVEALVIEEDVNSNVGASQNRISPVRGNAIGGSVDTQSAAQPESSVRTADYKYGRDWHLDEQGNRVHGPAPAQPKQKENKAGYSDFVGREGNATRRSSFDSPTVVVCPAPAMPADIPSNVEASGGAVDFVRDEARMNRDMQGSIGGASMQDPQQPGMDMNIIKRMRANADAAKASAVSAAQGAANRAQEKANKLVEKVKAEPSPAPATEVQMPKAMAMIGKVQAAQEGAVNKAAAAANMKMNVMADKVKAASALSAANNVDAMQADMEEDVNTNVYANTTVTARKPAPNMQAPQGAASGTKVSVPSASSSSSSSSSSSAASSSSSSKVDAVDARPVKRTGCAAKCHGNTKDQNVLMLKLNELNDSLVSLYNRAIQMYKEAGLSEDSDYIQYAHRQINAARN